MRIALTDDGFHILEIRNQAERNAASTGYKVRFKSLEVNRQYDLHTWSYDYDALARLLTANLYPGTNGTATRSRAYDYAYDLGGNRLSESLSLNGAAPTETSYSYNAANQISNAGFTYDANGNLTSDGTNTYTWGGWRFFEHFPRSDAFTSADFLWSVCLFMPDRSGERLVMSSLSCCR